MELLLLWKKIIQAWDRFWKYFLAKSEIFSRIFTILTVFIKSYFKSMGGGEEGNEQSEGTDRKSQICVTAAIPS